MGLNRLVVVAGPTGTGKSDIGLDLAQRFDGEIVNADSMQLYRGMDIGTAKLPIAERRGVPHHLLDVLDIDQRASVAAYQGKARDRIEDVLSRGRTPMLVGGSGLYISAVVDDIEFPGTDAAVRAELEAELAESGPAALSIPALNSSIRPRQQPSSRPTVAVWSGRWRSSPVTGRPFHRNPAGAGTPAVRRRSVACLDRTTESLDLRLQERVQTMVETGFLDEVRMLDALGLRDGVTASRALGYPQMLAVLDGLTDLEAAAAETVRLTRRFVRRQRSWFGRDQRMARLDAGGGDLTARAVEVAMATPASG